jgi:hypothetical protein
VHFAHGGLQNVIPYNLALWRSRLPTDRRQPPVLLSLLLSARHQTVIEQR